MRKIAKSMTAPKQEAAIRPDAWETLRDSHAAYMSSTKPEYDEILREVSARIRATGSIGKLDIGALLFWKRLQANTPWVPKLMIMPDRDVRAVTEKAVAAVNDESLPVPGAASAGRRALAQLPGFKSGDAMASAVLLAAAPERMAVYDERAQTALETLGFPLSAARGRYGRYMELVEFLRATADAHGHTWSARDVDVALFWLGGRNP